MKILTYLDRPGMTDIPVDVQIHNIDMEPTSDWYGIVTCDYMDDEMNGVVFKEGEEIKLTHEEKGRVVVTAKELLSAVSR